MADRSTQLSQILLNNEAPMANRFCALFALRTIGDENSYSSIIKCMTKTAVGTSSLLEHELAYVLGQMNGVKDQDTVNFCPDKKPHYAVSKSALETVLQDRSRNEVVRHESGEALAAMVSFSSLPILEKIRDDETEPQSIRETCDLACERLYWVRRVKENKDKAIDENTNPLVSIDPAPPVLGAKLADSCRVLCDTTKSIWDRYRAMFTIRNQIVSHNVTDEQLKQSIVDAFSEALHCSSSALFRHEIGYVLGQVLSSDCLNTTQIAQLQTSLHKSVEVSEEHEMVRHESAMALGELENDECKALLSKWSTFDECPMLADSCKVALSMVDDPTQWSHEQFSVAS